MGNLEVPENPEFSEEIEKWDINTLAYFADFNKLHSKLLNNTIFNKLKNAVLETEIAKSIAIALGRNQALVFDTYDEMAAWFADEANAEKVAALANGTNLYIVAKDVPDYWWSSVHQKYYELETQKADLTKYDNIIGTTDISGVGDGTITGAIDILKNKSDEINNTIDTLKKSVADGKTAVAAAISAKGVSTAADASYATMAANIGNISSASTITFTINIGATCTGHEGTRYQNRRETYQINVRNRTIAKVSSVITDQFSKTDAAASSSAGSITSVT